MLQSIGLAWQRALLLTGIQTHRSKVCLELCPAQGQGERAEPGRDVPSSAHNSELATGLHQPQGSHGNAWEGGGRGDCGVERAVIRHW